MGRGRWDVYPADPALLIDKSVPRLTPLFFRLIHFLSSRPSFLDYTFDPW